MSTKLPPDRELDPLFVHARREALTIIGLFTVFCIWSLVVCVSLGYVRVGDASQPEIATVLGMPSWVFWGIFLPWLAVDVVAVWFCFFYMKDDDLGEAHEGEDLSEQIGHDKEGRP